MKKVLIITYYWPPSGGIGVHRCLKFAKYLRNFGWEPVIYTAKDAQYPYYDESNTKDIPEGVEILKHKIVEPFNLFKLLSGRKLSEPMSNPFHVRDKKQRFIDKFSIWVRGNFFIPDARSLWINPSVRFLSKYLKDNHVDAILTNGPPHTNTYIGYKLAVKFNIPWLADFQDPWTQVDYYKELMLGPRADKKHRKMEQAVFNRANKITIASPSWGEELESIGAKNVSPIYWGYDNEDFKGLKKHDYKKFTISHAGILGYDRDPELLFKVLYELSKEDAQFNEKLSIRLAGMVDFSVLESIKKNGLEKNTILEGNMKREEALRLVISSNILLLPLNKAENAKGRIPGKLFEYLKANISILCLGPKESDSGNIIRKANRGESFTYDDYDGIKEYVKREYDKFLSGEITTPSDLEIDEYSVEKQTGIIAEYLNEITTSLY